jgi:simple sugar transport system ATP-binding protein
MSEPLLTARGITKKYGSVTALANADITVYPGQVCSLVGDNGAGKSTLVKILSGAETPTSGTITVGGTTVQLPNPAAAQEKGIATVFQDLALAPDLDATANMYLGREILRPGILGKIGILDRTAMKRDAAEQFSKLGITLRSPAVSVGSLSGGQRQSVAIARAARWANKVIFLDEPTAALGVVQTDRVLRLVRQVADQGLGVVLITHNMTHVVEVSDRIEVLRLGTTVATFTRGEATVQKLVTAMTTGIVTQQEAP